MVMMAIERVGAAVAAQTLPRAVEVLTLPNDADALAKFLSCAET